MSIKITPYKMKGGKLGYRYARFNPLLVTYSYIRPFVQISQTIVVVAPYREDTDKGKPGTSFFSAYCAWHGVEIVKTLQQFLHNSLESA